MICRNVRRLATVRRLGLAALSTSLRKSGISLLLAVLWLCAPASLPAQTFTTLASFNFTDDESPVGALVQTTDRNFYGTAENAGAQIPGRSGNAFPGAGAGPMSRSVNWSEFGFVPSGGRFNPDERKLSPRNAHGLHKLWSFFTGCNGSICGGSSATVANGVVYVGSYDGYVYALSAATGDKLWSFLTGGEIFSSPAVADGVVYVGSNDQNVYALTATTGAELWSYTTGYDVVSSPAVANGVVYIGSEDGSVYALNAATGAKLWSFFTPGDVYSSPAVTNGVVYVGSEDGNVYALNATTGAKLWSYHTGNQVFSSPTVANGVVYVGSGDGNMYAFGR
jgi:outer membrane protein assembly factor BamB